MPKTAAELANFLGAALEGPADLEVRGLASPEAAGPHDLIFVASAKHAGRAATTRAGCALIPAGVELPVKCVLRVPEPKLSFARAASWLLPPPELARGIHPTAQVSPSARLGSDVGIGPFVIIEDGVEIGKETQIAAYAFVGRGCRVGSGCRIHARVTLYAGVALGDNVSVHAGTVIGSDGFGYVYGEGRHWKFPQIGGVRVEDDVEIGANTTIDRGSLGTTRIGKGAKIDNLVQIAHNVVVGEHAIIAAQTGISGSSSVGNRVRIGGQVGIADACRIGDDAVVGAQAGVPTGKAVPPGQVVWGTPARPLAKFKEQYAWLGRLAQLAERVKAVERRFPQE